MPDTSGAFSLLNVAIMLRAVILPVFGFSSVGIFSIVIVNLALSDSTVIVCMLRSTDGSAHI